MRARLARAALGARARGSRWVIAISPRTWLASRGLGALVALLLGAPSTAVAQSPFEPSCPNTDTLPAPDKLPEVELATICLVNRERALRSRAPLRSQSQLSESANALSAEMVSEGFFAHVTPDGRTLRDRVAATGYMRPAAIWAIGENLAWGSGPLATPASIVAAWMASPPHRANLLDREFDRVGIGVMVGLPNLAAGGATYTLDLGSRTMVARRPR